MSKNTRISASVWNQDSYELLSSSEHPYYIVGFNDAPEITPITLNLSCGKTINVGDTVAYLGGNKTGAAYSSLHLFAPTVFRLVGRTDIDGFNLVLWEAMSDGEVFQMSEDKYEAMYYAHSLMSSGDEPVKLLYTNRACAGRIIETDVYYSSHDEIPKDLYPSEYQKKMGWVA